MPVVVDPQFEMNVGDTFGIYRGSLVNDQVRVDLFERGDELIGYVESQQASSAATAVTPFLRELNDHAAELGFADRLRLLFGWRSHV